MNRRDFLRLLSASSPTLVCGCSVLQHRYLSYFFERKSEEGAEDIAETKAPETSSPKLLTPQEISDELLKDARAKSLYFSQDFPDDIYFSGKKFELLKQTVLKFRGVQRHVGNGNFNLLGMDEFFHYSKYAAGISEVTPEEKLFLEELFFFDAKEYGFNGHKVFHNFTDVVKRSSTKKIPYTGHFLRKGESLELYNKIRRDVGDSIILTSGVRALAKQFHLFMEKALVTEGNMSKASRSLAPPGYSFHGEGDFDIGRVGFGLRNFTDDFATTDEYKSLLHLGYVHIRYTEMNLLGVRFEPWHIKVHPTI